METFKAPSLEQRLFNDLFEVVALIGMVDEETFTDSLREWAANELLDPDEQQLADAFVDALKDHHEPMPLQDRLDAISRREIIKTLHECKGNKTKAAEALGFPSYQTLGNWIDRLGITKGKEKR